MEQWLPFWHQFIRTFLGVNMTFFALCRWVARSPNGVRDGNRHEADALRLVVEGNRLEVVGRLEDALQCYAEAVKLVPNMARAHLNVGNILLASQDTLGALDAYATALTHQPDYAAAHYNLGNANARLHRAQAARACYLQALKLEPHFVDAEVALGNTLEDLQLLEESVQSYRRALDLNPNYAQVYYNLSNVLQKLGRLDEAVQSCCQALKLNPKLAEAYFNLGGVLREQNKFQEALAAFRQATALRTDFGDAATQVYACAKTLCDWSNIEEDEETLIDMIERGVPGIGPFFSLLSMDPPRGDAALLQRQVSLCFAEHQLRGRECATLVDPTLHPARRRLRIGYLSADFHEHATMHLLQGVLTMHDRANVAIHGYSYGVTFDAVSEKARESCEIYRDLVGLSDISAAELIASDGIDILVDLKGFTKDFRIGISALRPAPIIVSWLGYAGTLGLPVLADYLIGDPIVTPPENSAQFSETLALMPHCYQPNNRKKAIGPRPSRLQAGLPEEGFVFASFNQSYKLNPKGFDVWCNLMVQVPGSVLWLMAPTQDAIANLRREAVARGIAAERLIFAAAMPLTEHLGRLQLADLVLDTYPCTSHTTGSDALWAGVPMVTRIGSTFAGRVAASLLNAVGMPELITHDWEEYFSLAKSLALAPQTLTKLRTKLAVARLSAPLFDTERFTHNLERLYAAVWKQHERGVKELIQLTDSGTP